MSLYHAIKSLYPAATDADFRLQDDQDGTGPFVAAWNAAKLGPFPEPGALAAKAAELDPRVEPVDDGEQPPRPILELHPKLHAAAAARETATFAVADERANDLARRVAAEAAAVEQRLREHRQAALDEARRVVAAKRAEAEAAAAAAAAMLAEVERAQATVDKAAAALD